MHKILSTKSFWTFVCFVAFFIFTTSLITKLWWLNIFTMILGLLFKYFGDAICFPERAKLKRVREEKMQSYLDKRQEMNSNYVRNKRNRK
ncbi:hypothetical protein [uncultured Lactobacillus sp.]|uniref:hypothetical protein n=1 Tax=uncultured Lactobacillus sp. TaxID=153152 RepID=UPI0026218A00|nr:hypothetical protein [uncultured Lactobacillus sp.]